MRLLPRHSMKSRKRATDYSRTVQRPSEDTSRTDHGQDGVDAFLIPSPILPLLWTRLAISRRTFSRFPDSYHFPTFVIPPFFSLSWSHLAFFRFPDSTSHYPTFPIPLHILPHPWSFYKLSRFLDPASHSHTFVIPPCILLLSWSRFAFFRFSDPASHSPDAVIPPRIFRFSVHSKQSIFGPLVFPQPYFFLLLLLWFTHSIDPTSPSLLRLLHSIESSRPPFNNDVHNEI